MKRTSCQQSVIRNQNRLCRKETSSLISPTSYLERKQNFTLIELLIVIAIIAILAGMLLPALNNAREMAYTTDCTSRQKQFGTTFMLYADTYNEWSIGNCVPSYVPAPEWTSGSLTGKTMWFTLFARGHRNSTGITCWNFKSRYSSKSLHACPGRKTKGGVGDGNYAINEYLGQNYSRRGNNNWISQGKLTGDNANGSFFKPTSVPQPSSLMWMFCTDKYNSVTYRFYHNNKTINTMLFVDMTVQRLKKKDILPYNGNYRTLPALYPCWGGSTKQGW